MRGCAPPLMTPLMYSKLNAWISACRTRQSSKGARRVFITRPVIPEGRWCGISERTTAPDCTAGKS